MPLACVDDLQPGSAPCSKEFAIRINRAAQLRNIVSQHLAKPAGLKKVALHVDDEKGAVRWIKFEFVRFSINAQGPIQLHGSILVDKWAVSAWEPQRSIVHARQRRCINKYLLTEVFAYKPKPQHGLRMAVR